MGDKREIDEGRMRGKLLNLYEEKRWKRIMIKNSVRAQEFGLKVARGL